MVLAVGCWQLAAGDRFWFTGVEQQKVHPANRTDFDWKSQRSASFKKE
jgi:hypothetical protein